MGWWYVTDGTDARRTALRGEVGQRLGRRFSTAMVLFNSAVAERVGLNVTDYKCAEILFRTGPLHPGRLSELTGMSSAATSQVLSRLERAGMARREPDPHDRRRTIVHPVLNPAAEKMLGDVFAALTERIDAVLDRYDTGQLEAINDYLNAMTDVLEDQAAALRRRRG